MSWLGFASGMFAVVVILVCLIFAMRDDVGPRW